MKISRQDISIESGVDSNCFIKIMGLFKQMLLLTNSMQKREKDGLLLAAVQHGPSPPDHKIKGKETLINLVLRIKGLEDEENDARVPDLQVSDSLSDSNSDEELKLNEGIEEASVFDDSGEEDNIHLTQPPTVTR